VRLDRDRIEVTFCDLNDASGSAGGAIYPMSPIGIKEPGMIGVMEPVLGS
jgi:hypothetical protein